MSIITHLKLTETDKKHNIKSKSYFITALHRKADQSQRDELEKYGLEVNTTINKKETNKLVKKIRKDIENYDKIYIHLDENDYGTGYKQLLSQIWNIIQNNPDKCVTFTYSATGEQSFAEFCKDSPNMSDRAREVTYIPPATYYGIGCYLRDNKFRRSTEFFEYKRGKNEDDDQLGLTDQGENCLLELLKQTKERAHRRHIAVLRLSGNVTKKRGRNGSSKFAYVRRFADDIEDEFSTPECKLRVIFISTEDGTADWDDYRYWEDKESKIAYLIVVCEMAKRSTAWRNHPFICWYHTHRPNSNLNTKEQDQERPVLYTTQKYLADNNIPFCEIDITIYGCIHSAKYSAGWEGYQGTEGIEKLRANGINFSSNLRWNKRAYNSQWDYKYNWLSIDNFADREQIVRSVQQMEDKENVINKLNNPRILDTIRQIKFQKEITYREVPYSMPPHIWKKYKKYKGFVMPNIRSWRRDWLIKASKGIDPGCPPIFTKDDIEEHRNSALGTRKKFRLYPYYNDNETNPSNYKIALTYIESKEVSQPRTTTNTAMYNIEIVEEDDD
tara:strand:- start:129 stop:1799 length:1671 start_codon:yes stop_codon:yes gene_type:complete